MTTAPRTKRQRSGTTAAGQSTAQDTKSGRPIALESPASSIADLAYRLFLARGGTHGHDVDDWLEAERQILGGQE